MSRVSFSRRWFFLAATLAVAGLLASSLAASKPNEAAHAAGAALTLYVAPGGSDAWSGRLAAPAPGRKDGPFATVEAARQAVAKRQAVGGLSGPVTVWIRGGTYPLTAPLRFTSADSGTANAPVTYAAYKKETPVFTGNATITPKWRSYPGNPQIKVTHIDRVASGQWDFNRLTVGTHQAARARVPAAGKTFQIVPFGPAHLVPTDDPQRQLHFYAELGDIDPHWTNFQDIEISKTARFSNTRARLRSMDAATGLVTAAAPVLAETCSYGADYGGTDHYFLDNVFEGLAPGLWYLNRRTGDLYYWPRAGEKIEGETFAAPAVSSLLAVTGTPASPVHDLTFQGLTFAHTTSSLPMAGYRGFVPVSEIPDPAAVEIGRADRLTFRACTVHDVTGAGIRQLQTSRSAIRGCHVDHTAGAGIQLGGPDEVTAAPNPTASYTDNVVADNTVHDVGLTYFESPGIIEYHQAQSVIAHNLVYNTPGSGIYLRGTKAADAVGGNRVEYNSIHDVMQQIDDDGGIYLINANPNTNLIGNVIHDVGQYGRWYRSGIYLDVGQSKMQVRGNRVYRAMVGLMLNGGSQEPVQDITITDNVFADCSWFTVAFQQDPTSQALTGITFRHNILSVQNTLRRPLRIEGVTPTDRYPFSKPYAFRTAGGVTTTQVTSDDNVFYNPKHLAAWQNGIAVWKNPALQPAPGVSAVASDAHSLEADPQFQGYARDDFSLRPSSPALSLGVRPVDVSRAGPRLF